MNKKTLISVVIATHNGATYIDQQIKSILQQLDLDDEIIVSDDHSSDSTIRQIVMLDDPRLKIFIPSKRLGPIGNFEHGLTQARNDVVVLSDQDDVWLSGRVEVIRDYFTKSCTPYDLLVMNSCVVNEQLETVEPSVFKLIDCGPGITKNIYRNTYIGCHMAFKRSLLDVALPFPKRIPMHDVWLGLVSELLGEVTFRDEPTMLFRRTGNNFTKANYNWITRINWRLNLVLGLLFFFLFRRNKPFSGFHKKLI